MSSAVPGSELASEESAEEALLDAALEPLLSDAVPAIADWCFVDAIDETRTVQRIAVAHPADADRELVRALEEYPVHLDLRPPPGAVDDGPALVESPIEYFCGSGNGFSDSYTEAIRRLAPRSAIIATVRDRERVLGEVTLMRAGSDRTHGPADLAAASRLVKRMTSVLESDAVQAGVSFARQRAEEGRALVRFMHRVFAPLSREGTEEDAVRRILAEAKVIIGADVVSAALYDRYRNDVTTYIEGPGNKTSIVERLAAGASAPLLQALRSGRPQWMESAVETRFTRLRAATGMAEVSSFAAVPMLEGEQALGALGFGFFKRRDFQPEDRELYEMFAAHAASLLFVTRMGALERDARQARKEADRRADLHSGFAETMLRHAPVVTMVLEGPEHTVREVNGAAVVRSSVDPALFAGRPHGEVAPELHAKIGPLLDEAFGSGEPQVISDLELSVAEEVRHLRISLIPLPDLAGRPRGVVLMSLDITEIVLAEQKKAELHSREREARERAEHADRMKDEFLARASHELATPLAAMRMWLHLLRKKAPESVAHELAAIERCADAQGRLVTDLLDVSRALRGKLSMEATTVDLAEVVAPVVENMRPDATAKQLTLGADLERGCLVRGDPNRLRQVATNLLSNAIKFTREHGKVSVSVAHDGDRVVLAVEDDGVGIEVEQLAKIFEPFWQASESTTRSYGGLGLGLAIVKQIVELHGGAVRAESLGRDQGARLLVVLESADAAPLPDAVEGPRSSLEGMSVLLVEDDVETRDSVALVLKSFGADVRVAASAADGMRELEASVPDVFLCDVSMPGEDGYSLMRRVRRSEGPQAKVLAVAFTAHARTEDRQRAREAGFNEHLGKPIAPEDLAAAILKLSRGRRST